MFSKNLFLLFIGSWVWFSGLQAMEAWSLENPQENTTSEFNNDDLITIQITKTIGKVNPAEAEHTKKDAAYIRTLIEDDILYGVTQEIDVPYKIIKPCSVLRKNISPLNNTVSIPAPFSTLEMYLIFGYFLKIHTDTQLNEETKSQNIHTTLQTFNEDQLFKLLDATNYLDCKPIYKLAMHSALQKLKDKLFKNNDLEKTFQLTEYIENTDHYAEIFEHACENGEYVTEILHTLPPINSHTLTGHTNDVRSVCISPDSKTIASGSHDKTIKLWDVTSGTCINTLTGHEGYVISVCFSHDGKTIASGSVDKTIKLWDVASGNCIKTLTGHTGFMYSVCFSPDDTTIASGSYDKTIRVWDVASGNYIKTLTGHIGGAISVCFSPDGTTIASGSADNTLKLWNVASGNCIETLTGHEKQINSVCFSPDGKVLVSCSHDGTIRVWSVASRKCLHTLTGLPSYSYSTCLSPNGKTIASGFLTGSVGIYTLPNGHKDFTLSTLLFLEYLMHQKEHGTLHLVKFDEKCHKLFELLPDVFKRQFSEIFNYDVSAKQIEEKKD